MRSHDSTMSNMPLRPRLLLLCQHQFGYHSDTYHYCRHLANRYEISYLCWDYRQKKLTVPDVKVIYVSRKGNLASRNLRYIQRAVHEIGIGYDYHFIKYFRGCSLIQFLSKKSNFLLDIRSASVLEKKWNRIVYNLCMKAEMALFKNISVISMSLAQKLKISHRAFILPLGADIISSCPRKMTQMQLLYVGTLYNRNIEKTVRGFQMFYELYKDRIPLRFTIVGTGFTYEETQLKSLVRELGLESVVKVKGHVPYDELQPFFDQHNIGISFIPLTDYFDVQPPTKTFEYLLSGMPVIATQTLENKAVISSKDGVLIKDTAHAFFDGLTQLYKNLSHYDTQDIRSRAMSYTWGKIAAKLDQKFKHLIRQQHQGSPLS